MNNTTFRCRFKPHGWHMGDWLMVRSPRWDYDGEWIQERDHIRNRVPGQWKPEKMVEGGPGAAETYTSMVYCKPLEDDFTVTTRMSFDYRMAPLVVLAAEPVYKGGQREYREHCEVVLFDEGVNVWTHGFSSAGPHWILAAYWRFPLEANIAHRLQVQRQGAQLKMILGDRRFGCVPAGLPATVFTGITACEGVNRFYEFGIEA